MDETSPQPQRGAQRCAWYQRSHGGFRLCSVPLEVAKPLADWRKVLRIPWVFTSATLAVDGSFEHLQREWGLAGASTLRIESPFDYQSHARLYVPRDFPNPNRKEAHRQQLLALAMRLLRASQGRAFLLFTSHEALQWFAKALRQEQQRGLSLGLCSCKEIARTISSSMLSEKPRARFFSAPRASGRGGRAGASAFAGDHR